MLWVGSLMIVNGQNIKKISFNFPAAEGGKLHQQVVPQPLAPVQTPKNAQKRVYNMLYIGYLIRVCASKNIVSPILLLQITKISEFPNPS